MKRIQLNWFVFVLFVFLSAILLSACGSGGGDDSSNDGDSSNISNVDPTNANAISEVLVVPGATAQSGALPSASSGPNAPAITRSESNVSYSAGSQVVLPIDYQLTNSNDLSALLYTVSGSSNYSRVDLNGKTSGASGSVTLPVTIPANVSSGKFCLDIAFQDSNGLVSATQQVCVMVSQPLGCDITRVSGGEGLTSTVHKMGGGSGQVRVDYQTYTVPDRIDIFAGGVWMAGTGSSIDRSALRTALDCSQATPAKGYVGEEGKFNFSALGGDVEVVVSGCEHGGTAWEYTIECPREYQRSFCAYNYCEDCCNELNSDLGLDNYEWYFVPGAGDSACPVSDDNNVSQDYSYTDADDYAGRAGSCITIWY